MDSLGKNSIEVIGAQENNLKNISVEIPHNKFVAISGISGSGKSSLAFNTIYMEAQRRYMETLSAYARQFIGNFDRPDVEHIDGLRPTISIDQKTISRNPRSTVGTLTEIYDYMRVLYARVGIPHCPGCKVKIEAQPSDQIIEQLFASFEGERIKIIAPVFEKRKGEYRKELAQWKEEGYIRLIIDGKEINLDDENVKLERYVAHDIEIIVDRNKCERRNEPSIRDSITLALELANGKLKIISEKKERRFSTKLVCPQCGLSVNEFHPRDFSYNTAVGACRRCKGLGKVPQIVPEKYINKELSIAEGAVATTTSNKKYITYSGVGMKGIGKIAEEHGFNLNTPIKDLTEEQYNVLFYGSGSREYKLKWEWGSEDTTWKGKGEYITTWKGLIPATMNGYYRIESPTRKADLEKFMELAQCPSCKGARLKTESLSVLFKNKNISELNQLPIDKCLSFFEKVKLTKDENKIAGPLLKEIKNRLSFMIEVGLHYITLDRAANELSGGEAQRTRLATQIGSKLQGVTYLLDEPSIGLANRDNHMLLNSLTTLRDGGNTVVVVEHDEDTLRSSDILVDLGPKAGDEGGEVLFSIDPNNITKADAKGSITARYLLGLDEIAIPAERRKSDIFLVLRGAQHNNLKNIDVKFPVGNFICITGVSGSGKSSLVTDTLYPILVNTLHNGTQKVGKHKKLEGIENIDKAVVINQSPIGRNPRSNPATYTKVLDHIRDLFAKMPTAKVRGYNKTRFSFNTKIGRCEACKGHGYNTIEMSLLPDVEVECEICKGRRFDDETLKIKFADKSIAEILDMTVNRAMKVFKNQPKILRILQTLSDVGLDYIKLGQPSTTLSGGEAQRIKLSRELAKRSTGQTMYLLDEPTTGLSFEDIKKLLAVLQKLVDMGNTIVIIEHNLDVIKTADHVIDLGPDGGEDNGGYLVAEGTPEKILECEESFTGKALKKVLLEGYVEDWETKKAALDEDLDPSQYLHVRGASKNNLKSINLDIPKEQLVVITGPSGSGKSSLAIDTLFAEGQRRFIESLSSYARQFLIKAERADVEDIIGLTPSIAIHQHSISKNPRSTVATTTEIYDYLRLLFAKIGISHCPVCKIVLKARTADEVSKLIEKDSFKKSVIIASSLTNGEEIDVKKTIKELVSQGYSRVIIEEKEYHVDDEIKKKKTSLFSVVVDRINIKEKDLSRLSEAVEAAVKLGKGRVEVYYNGEKNTYSIYPECIDHDYEAPEEMHPRLFSFNHYSGSCTSCTGLGSIRKLDMRKIVTNWNKTILEGAIGPYTYQRLVKPNSWRRSMLQSIADYYGYTLDTPMKDLSPQQLDALFYGSKGEVIKLKYKRERERSSSEFTKTAEWEGLIPRWERWLAEPSESRYSREYKERYNKYYTEYKCPDCNGRKLKPEILAITVSGNSINDLATSAVDEFLDFLENVKLTKRDKKISERIILELKKRAQYLVDVGLSYLTLNRRSSTLSNGEAQRIRLASQVGSGLVGVTYLLDEPTIGLHPKDINRLLNTLKKLRDNGNHVIVVEHDEAIIKESQYMVELGPLGGDQGGEIISEGPTSEILEREDSLTAKYLSKEHRILTPEIRRKAQNHILVKGAAENNLKDIDVEFGLGTITAVTGISGAGKSSLVIEILQKGLERALMRRKIEVGKHKSLSGYEELSKVIVVDQSALSKSRRSNPATYLGVFDEIRKFYSKLPESRANGFDPGHFSYNTYKGQCHECYGLGMKRIELLFLSDVWLQCPACKGKKYKKKVLAARYKQKTISDILELSISEACELFKNIEKIYFPLKIANDVGLGYLRMGQPTTTISGGEAERLKITRELAKKGLGKNIYLIDEPSQGLHYYDIEKLIIILQKLANEGNTIVFIDRNMDLVKIADKVIDLGPEGGKKGGYLVAKGTPEEIISMQKGYTWEYLKQVV